MLVLSDSLSVRLCLTASVDLSVPSVLSLRVCPLERPQPTDLTCRATRVHRFGELAGAGHMEHCWLSMSSLFSEEAEYHYERLEVEYNSTGDAALCFLSLCLFVYPFLLVCLFVSLFSLTL